MEEKSTNERKIPNHLAVIMDGNGRWAKKRLLPRSAGHVQGAKTVEKMCEEVDRIGIKYFTVYAFSTENWNRPSDEIGTLMKLLKNYLRDCVKRSMKNNMRVRVLGDISALSEDLRESIEELERVSENNTGLNFQVALNYGGRDEILRAVRKMAQDYREQDRDLNEITEEVFSAYLDTKGVPDPDLLIRTSGELRLSNFLLWQMAYTEFYFPKVLWPDFNRDELEKAIDYFNGRDRRFGAV